MQEFSFSDIFSCLLFRVVPGQLIFLSISLESELALANPLSQRLFRFSLYIVKPNSSCNCLFKSSKGKSEIVEVGDYPNDGLCFSFPIFNTTSI